MLAMYAKNVTRRAWRALREQFDLVIDDPVIDYEKSPHVWASVLLMCTHKESEMNLSANGGLLCQRKKAHLGGPRCF